MVLNIAARNQSEKMASICQHRLAAGLLAVLGVLAVTFGQVSAEQTSSGFVAGVDDLPLVTGFKEVAGSAMNFDTPSGRILEVQTAGAADQAQVSDFYSAALPQLGWQEISTTKSKLQFQRDDEILEIDISVSKNGGTLVQFRIAPQVAGSTGSAQ